MKAYPWFGNLIWHVPFTQPEFTILFVWPLIDFFCRRILLRAPRVRRHLLEGCQKAVETDKIGPGRQPIHVIHQTSTNKSTYSTHIYGFSEKQRGRLTYLYLGSTCLPWRKRKLPFVSVQFEVERESDEQISWIYWPVKLETPCQSHINCSFESWQSHHAYGGSGQVQRRK